MGSSSPRRALIAGATGLVGRELVERLLADPACRSLTVLVRRLDALPPRPKLALVELSDAALASLPALDDVYVALGTTIAVAGSEAAFRAVDLDLVVAVARAARAAGATRLALVSAHGADTRSRIFYNRVKGEAEAAVRTLGFERVAIARPSLLLGHRERLGQPPRPIERLAMRLGPLLGVLPASVRPIAAGAVAAALVDALHRAPSGVEVLTSAGMQSFARAGHRAPAE
ncbi:NAD(P)H-binding protein [Schlegelella sp. ID0723]|uniref:NAD(P)H-binding protein n=2 Tax=Piscinibacter koreensis TaxID=2742824 RepID=A0A7Y6TXL2_9BURK|nr:NAD(P)H-binding protein [Schlegelella koreensis]